MRRSSLVVKAFVVCGMGLYSLSTSQEASASEVLGICASGCLPICETSDVCERIGCIGATLQCYYNAPVCASTEVLNVCEVPS